MEWIVVFFVLMPIVLLLINAIVALAASLIELATAGRKKGIAIERRELLYSVAEAFVTAGSVALFIWTILIRISRDTGV